MIFHILIENLSVRREDIRGKGAQVLRGAASGVGPLALRLIEGGPLFSGGSHLKRGGVGKRYYTGNVPQLFLRNITMMI